MQSAANSHLNDFLALPKLTDKTKEPILIAGDGLKMTVAEAENLTSNKNGSDLALKIADLATACCENGYPIVGHRLHALTPELRYISSLEGQDFRVCLTIMDDVINKSLPHQTSGEAISALQHTGFRELSILRLIDNLRSDFNRAPDYIAFSNLGNEIRKVISQVELSINSISEMEKEVLRKRENIMEAIPYQANQAVQRWLEAALLFRGDVN